LEPASSDWKIIDAVPEKHNPINKDDRRLFIDIFVRLRKEGEKYIEILMKDQRGFHLLSNEKLSFEIKEGKDDPKTIELETNMQGTVRHQISSVQDVELITKNLKCLSHHDKIDFEILEIKQILPKEWSGKKGKSFKTTSDEKDFKFEIIVYRKYLELTTKDEKGRTLPNCKIKNIYVADGAESEYGRDHSYGGHTQTDKNGKDFVGPLSLSQDSIFTTENLEASDGYKIIGITQVAPKGGPVRQMPGKDVVCKSSASEKEFKVDIMLKKKLKERLLFIKVQDSTKKNANLLPDFILENVLVEENGEVSDLGPLKTAGENAGTQKGHAQVRIGEGTVKLLTDQVKSGVKGWEIEKCYTVTGNPIDASDEYMEAIVVVKPKPLVIEIERAKYNMELEDLDLKRKLIVKDKDSGKEIASKSLKDILASSPSRLWSISLDGSVFGHSWVVSLDRDDGDTSVEGAEFNGSHIEIDPEKKVEITLAQGDNHLMLYLGKSLTFDFSLKLKSGKVVYNPIKDIAEGSKRWWAMFPVRVKNSESRALSLRFDASDVRHIPNNLFVRMLKFPFAKLAPAATSWVVSIKSKDSKYSDHVDSSRMHFGAFDQTIKDIPPGKAIDFEIYVCIPSKLVETRMSVVPTFLFHLTPIDNLDKPITKGSKELEIKAEKLVNDMPEAQQGPVLSQTDLTKNQLRKKKIVGGRNIVYDFDEKMIPNLKKLSFSLKALAPDLEYIKSVIGAFGKTTQKYGLAAHLNGLKKKMSIERKFKTIYNYSMKVNDYLVNDDKMKFLKENCDDIARLLLLNKYEQVRKVRGDLSVELNKEIDGIVQDIKLLEGNYLKFKDDIKTINAKTEESLAKQILTINEVALEIEAKVFQLGAFVKLITGISQ